MTTLAARRFGEHDKGRRLRPGAALCTLLLLLASLPGRAADEAAARAPGFGPIPVQVLPRPVGAHLSADEALASVRAEARDFKMTSRASKPWRIAFLFPHLKDPYWIGCSYGVVNEARRLGVIVDIQPADGYKDLIGQLRQMDEDIARRYDAIVISPISLTANNASVAKARAAGIPVFELANDSTSDDLTIKVTTSLKAMGRDATQWVIRDAQRRGLKSVRLGLLPGPADAGWVKGEVEGTREAARAAPLPVHIVDIRYGDSDRIEQSQLAAQMLAQHGKEIDYLIGCTGCAPAARLPLQQAGLAGQIRIVAYDLTREIARMIREGTIAAAADTKGVSQARVVTDAVVDVLEHRDAAPPYAVLIRLGMVDQTNAANYPFDTSIAPEGFAPVLSYDPRRARAD